MPLAHKHLDVLREALKSEERFSRTEHERVAALDLNERVALGQAWVGVKTELTPSMRRREVRILVRGDLHEGIGAGDAVVVNGERGRCVGWDPTVAELVFDRGDEEQLLKASVVELAFDASSWVEWRKALERADEHTSSLVTALLEGPEAASTQHPLVTPTEPSPHAWDGLNAAQSAAASAAFAARDLAVIHGPPGTGKTRTLVALLGALEGTRWALAESNAAVDNLALGAAAAGLHVVRVGPAHRMSGPVRSLSVDDRMMNGPWAGALDAIDRDISRAADGPERRALYDQRRELRTVARDHVLQAADVIATTFGSLARRGQELPPAHTAVVDEVTQAIEPAVWSVVPHVQRLLLAGDPHQLGPVVVEPGNPLQEGLLDRLAGLGTEMPMLEEQHRMNTGIMSLVRGVYGPDYRAHPSVADHRLDALATQPIASLSEPAIFVDTAGMGEEARDPLSRSVFNELEVKLVGIALQELLDHGVAPESIGVIAPYSAQVARLSALSEANGVEVATVNAFQGREAEVILMSFTRSNPDGEIGFLADRRRLTVALTRARRQLWMCGDVTTLLRDSSLAGLIDEVPMRSVWEPPWAGALEA